MEEEIDKIGYNLLTFYIRLREVSSEPKIRRKWLNGNVGYEGLPGGDMGEAIMWMVGCMRSMSVWSFGWHEVAARQAGVPLGLMQRARTWLMENGYAESAGAERKGVSMEPGLKLTEEALRRFDHNS